MTAFIMNFSTCWLANELHKENIVKKELKMAKLFCWFDYDDCLKVSLNYFFVKLLHIKQKHLKNSFQNIR